MKNFNQNFFTKENFYHFGNTSIKYQIGVLNIIKFLDKINLNEDFDDIYCFIEGYFDTDEQIGDFFTFKVVLDNGDDSINFHFRYNIDCYLEKDNLSVDLYNYGVKYHYEYDA